MTKDEALTLALEALEELHAMIWGECPSLLNEDSGGDSTLDMECKQAITAIKEALAQPEQEPVAWIEKARLDWLTKYGDEADVYTLVTKYKFGYDVPLYITPPQRTWVGLASEDRLTAKYMQDAPDGIEAVIDYIESKLKELNT